MGGYDIVTLGSYLVSFNASSPFYFIRHYINLTLLAPIIFYLIKSIQKIKYRYLQYVSYVVSLICFLIIGHISVGKAGYTSESYLFIYALGMVLGGISNIKKRANMFGMIGMPLIIYGYYSTFKFYMARVYEGNYAYAEGVDAIMPNFQLNPPNLSIMIYSVGVFCILMFLFVKIEKTEGKISFLIISGFGAIGKNSLDIFLWHMLVLSIVITSWGKYLVNQLLINITLYSAVLVVPVLGRGIYSKIKNNLYVILTNNNSQ